MKRTVLLFSGGIDSTVLLHKLRSEDEHVTCLGFDYGQPHVIELDHAEKLAGDNEFVRMKIPEFLSVKRDQFNFPNRNMVFLSLAVAWAEQHGDDSVAIACHHGDHSIFPDCRPAFLDPMWAATKAATEGRVWLQRPFLHLDKWEIVRLGRELDVPFEDTRSCYAVTSSPCGSCLACTERREALLAGGAYVPNR